MTDDRGAPIAYTVLEEGTPVETRDGVRLGKVKAVRGDVNADIFDGIIVDTDDGDRFVDAPEVDSIYERCVVIAVDAGEADDLPEPEPGPATLAATPDDIAGDTPGDKVKHAAKRAWDRLSGNYSAAAQAAAAASVAASGLLQLLLRLPQGLLVDLLVAGRGGGLVGGLGRAGDALVEIVVFRHAAKPARDAPAGIGPPRPIGSRGRDPAHAGREVRRPG